MDCLRGFFSMRGLFSIQKNARTEFEQQSIAEHTKTLQSGGGWVSSNAKISVV